MSTTPEANLLPVSMTPMAKLPRYQRHRRQICHQYQRYRQQILPPVPLVLLTICHRRRWHRLVDTGGKQWEQYQAADTSKWTWRQISTTQRCPNKIIKIFLLEDFLHLPPASTTPVVHLEPRISPQILGKIWNGLNGILRCLGETDSWKNQNLKISWHCPFKVRPLP